MISQAGDRKAISWARKRKEHRKHRGESKRKSIRELTIAETAAASSRKEGNNGSKGSGKLEMSKAVETPARRNGVKNHISGGYKKHRCSSNWTERKDLRRDTAVTKR